MRNIPNQIVQGDDSFDRAAVIDQVFRLADTGSVLLHGPRRMGKTSALRRIEALAPARGFGNVAYIDVEDARTEIEFLQHVLREYWLRRHGP